MQQKTPNFDTSASTYDATFTLVAVGATQRKQVYRLLENTGFFKDNTKVFEINCGTGYDAAEFAKRGLQVYATDFSKGMIAEAQKKRPKAIQFEVLDCKETHLHHNFLKSDILFSNFGGLNCLSPKELDAFIVNIAKNQSTSKQIAWVIMPKICFVESVYFLFKGAFSKIFRRNTAEALKVHVDGVYIPTYYHSPSHLRKALAPYYDVKLIQTVAFFTPPSYMDNLFSKRKELLNFLYKCDKLFGKILPASWSDHYIIIAKRK